MGDAEKSEGIRAQAEPARALARSRASEHTITGACPAHAGNERDHDQVVMAINPSRTKDHKVALLVLPTPSKMHFYSI